MLTDEQFNTLKKDVENHKDLKCLLKMKREELWQLRSKFRVIEFDFKVEQLKLETEIQKISKSLDNSSEGLVSLLNEMI